MRQHNPLLSLRVRFHEQARLGPGKIALLEAVQATRSVASAGARMDMSARRAWLLIDSLNNAFSDPLVAVSDPSSPGASEASLTALGEAVIAAYRAVEEETANLVQARFANILDKLRTPPDPS